MLAAVDQAGVKLQIGFMRRFDAGFVAAKQRIDAGEIGRVVLVKSLTHGPSIPKPWMYDIRKSNGPLVGGEQPRHRHAALVQRQRVRGGVRDRRQLSLARRPRSSIPISTTT